MFENTLYLQTTGEITHNQALKMFTRALLIGKIRRLCSRISVKTAAVFSTAVPFTAAVFSTAHSSGLLDLNAIERSQSVRGRHYAGIQTVLTRDILGTEGRANDFDASFNPLSEKTRDRWISIANARLYGTALPAIELIQVGQVYFVRDGHHRISVARAFGEEAIDAHVTVWDVRDTPAETKSHEAFEFGAAAA
jgi:hypothetical protein